MKKFLIIMLSLVAALLCFIGLTGCKDTTVENVKISFYVDDEVIQTIETSGNESIAIPNDPEKKGYEFDGWYRDKNTWQEPFTANSLLDTPIRSNLSVYAKLNEINYSITYNCDGGSNNNPNTYTVNSNFSLKDSEKEGHTFNGWYKESDFQTEITNIVEGTIGDLELYASFSINQYSITFDSDGGTNILTIIQNFDTTVAEPQEPEKSGYKFLGWFEENSQTEYIFDKIEARNVELKAKWQTQSYNIVYNLDDGTNGNNPTTYTVEDEITLLAASKTGYEFIGWFTDSAYNNEVSTIAIGTTGDIELWVKFEIENYAINYRFDNEKGQMPTPANATSYTILDEVVLEDLTNIKTGYMFDGWFDAETEGNEISKIAVGTTGVKEIYARFSLIDYKIILNNTKNVSTNIPTTYTVEDANIALGNISKDGYTFNGWFTQEDGSERITQIVTANAQDIYLYAEWSIIDYTATFKADGNQVGEVLTFNVENMSVIEPSVPEKTGYTGAWEDYTLGIEDITIYAVYTGIEYTATFMDGTTVVEEIKFTVETESIDEPTVPNHVGYNGEWEAYTLGLESITIDAVYSLIPYVIIYKNVGDATNTNPTTYTIENDDFELTDIGATGYTFEGWYTANGGGERITQIVTSNVVDITLYARWTAIEYTITYSNTNGAVNYNPVYYNIESNISLSNLTINGYVFLGWYTINDEKITTISNGTTGDITLIAKWELEEFTISYSLDEGINHSDNVTSISILSKLPIKLQDAKKENYYFMGWYLDELYTNKITQITECKNYTLYAKFILGSEGFTYTLSSDETYYIISDYNGADEIVYVPYVHSNLPVRVIGENTFSNKSIKKVYISSNINTIGMNAFFACNNLIDIVIPNSITEIRDNAFSNCSSLKEIMIPNSVVNIGAGVFKGCSSLTTITIPFIGASANANNGFDQVFGYIFGYFASTSKSYNGMACQYNNGSTYYHYYVPTSLIDVTILDTNIICANAFMNCKNIKNITISESVNSILNNAFANTNLETVIYLGGIENWCNITFSGSSSNPIYNSAKLYIDNQLVRDVIIPDGITELKEYIFSGYNYIESITIPYTVTSIGAGAFMDVSTIENVYYNGSVAEWCKIAFYNRYSSPININTHLYIAGELVTDLKLPKTIKEISSYSFYNCTTIENVYYQGTLEDWCNIKFNNQYANPLNNGAKLFINNELLINFTTPNNILELKPYLFYGYKHLQSVNIGSNLNYIKEYVFAECASLSTVEFGENSILISIGKYAFSGCEQLLRLNIPNNVESIAEFSFYGCNGLEEISLPFVGESMTANKGYNEVFGYIFGYTKTTTTDSNRPKTCHYYESEFKYTTYAHFEYTCYTYYIPTSIKTVRITGSSNIATQAFRNCSNLKEVYICENVQNIEDKIFELCVSLEKITLPLDAMKYTYFGYLFGATKYEENAKYVLESLDSVTVLGSSIGEYAFNGCCSINEIIISGSVLNIDDYAFEDSNVKIIWDDPHIETIGSLAFSGYLGTEIIIPSSVKLIEAWAFENCINLTSIVIPSSVTDIYKNAFLNCTSLNEIILERTEGWQIRKWTNMGYSGWASIKASDLIDENKAAEYFTQTSKYLEYEWKNMDVL